MQKSDLLTGKKLLLLTDTFPYGKGEKTFILPELSYLAKNFDVTVISSASREDRNKKELETELPQGIGVRWYSEESVQGIGVVKYFLPFLFYKGSWQEILAIVRSKKLIFSRLKKILFFFANAEKFRRWLAKEQIIGSQQIICYSYWYVHRILSIIMDLKKYPNVKLVTRAHGYDLYEERNACCWQPYKKVMDLYIDKVFFISKQGHDYYKERFAESGQESEKYVINYLGTNRQETDVKRTKNYPFLLVSCGSLLPVKRISLIIEALALVKNYKIKWVHFGDGDDYDRLKYQAQEQLDGKSNILYELRGYIANENIISYYKKEHPDCFIMTSVSEGSPVAMQEAISFGMPVIGTAVGGIPEMIEGNGILLSGNPSAHEVAKAIQDMCELDEDAYQKMQKQSLEIWNQNFDRKKNIMEFIRILKQLSDG